LLRKRTETFVDLSEQEQDRLQDLSVGGLKKVKRLVDAANGKAV
jgi:hypothetical protein